MQPMKQDDLLIHFLDFEDQNKLFDIELNGIKIWGFIRCWVYTFLVTAAKNIDLPVKSNMKNTVWKNALKSIFYFIKSTRIKQSDILIIPHPRRVKQDDNKYYCLYTDFLKEHLEKHYSTIALEEPYWAEYIGSKTSHFYPVPYNNIFYTDIYEIDFLIKKFFTKSFNRKQFTDSLDIIEKLLEKIDIFFNTPIRAYKDILLDLVLYVILMLKKYERIFNKVNPKVLIEFYCPGVFRNIMTYIANSRDIPVIEMQHGVYATENIFYKFKRKAVYTPLPNYVFAFGDALFDKMFLPFTDIQSHVFNVGYIFLDKKLEEYTKNVNSNPRTTNILIISQGTLNRELRLFTKELAALITPDDDIHIIYKKHPYEKEVNYSDLSHKNITVVGNNSKDVYFYLSQATCQVGVYSTVLYEGLRFGLPTFVVKDLYGATQTQQILGNTDGVFYIKSPKDVYNFIKNNKKSSFNRRTDNIWAKVNIVDILEKIDTIMTTSQP